MGSYEEIGVEEKQIKVTVKAKMLLTKVETSAQSQKLYQWLLTCQQLKNSLQYKYLELEVIPSSPL